MSDKLVLQEGQVELTTQEGKTYNLPEEKLVDMIRRQVLPPIDGVAFPDGVKFVRWQSPFLCVVHQLPAHVRPLRWITKDSPVPFGTGTQYQTRRLSLPYAVTFAVYCQSGKRLALTGYNELYFRNQPLNSKSDSLCFPALLNVSRIDIAGRSRAWICTQHLRPQPQQQWDAQLGKLIEHTWNGAFNLSSEHHEGRSWYGESEGIHPDLHPIDRWEQASAKNDAFALGVSWKPSPLNVDQLMSALLDESKQQMEQRPLRARSKRQSAGLVSQFVNFAQQQPAAKS